MGAAEELVANLDSVANYSALAMFTNRRNRLNRALKAVKCVPRTGGNQFEGLVIIIAHSSHFGICQLTLERIGRASLAQFRVLPKSGVKLSAPYEVGRKLPICARIYAAVDRKVSGPASVFQRFQLVNAVL